MGEGSRGRGRGRGRGPQRTASRNGKQPATRHTDEEGAEEEDASSDGVPDSEVRPLMLVYGLRDQQTPGTKRRSSPWEVLNRAHSTTAWFGFCSDQRHILDGDLKLEYSVLWLLLQIPLSAFTTQQDK